MNDSERIGENLKSLTKEIPAHCSLIAVSKYVGVKEIKYAYDWGQRDFGENRVPDLIDKSNELKKECPDIRWHMIGRLQSNKIKKLLTVENLIAVHSLFEIHHMEILNQYCRENLQVLIQVNTSNEENKGGVFNIEGVKKIIEKISNPHLLFSGLMTMGKLNGSKEENIDCFKRLKNMADSIKKEAPLKTSMGMSGDYRDAISCGADFVRVGSLIFR